MDPDTEIMIDHVIYDVYFILGVTSDDPIEHITKEYKKKAKVLHPDKLSTSDRSNPTKLLKRNQQFKILVECYDFIRNKKQRYNQVGNEPIINNTSLDPKNFDNTSEINSFNNEFTKLKVTTPSDFGYTTERLGMLNESNFEELKGRYATETFKPTQVFNTKKFDPDNFNKAFEYHQSQFEDTSTAIIHKTSDGFSGYNSGFLSGPGELGCASVSSFNGVMIVGDNFGESGIGYNDGNYSDYQMSFKKPKNPNKIDIPNDFIATGKITPMSKKEADEQLRLRNKTLNVKIDGNFNSQEQILLQKQKRDIQEKIANDKNLILKYQNMFDKQTIQAALGNKLISSDYTHQEQIPQIPQTSSQQTSYTSQTPLNLPEYPKNTRSRRQQQQDLYNRHQYN